jgi:hypothetical protein
MKCLCFDQFPKCEQLPRTPSRVDNLHMKNMTPFLLQTTAFASITDLEQYKVVSGIATLKC